MDGVEGNTSDNDDIPHSTAHNPHQFLYDSHRPLKAIGVPVALSSYYAPPQANNQNYQLLAHYEQTLSPPPIPLLGGGGREYNHNDKYNKEYDDAEDGKGLRRGADDRLQWLQHCLWPGA